MTYENAVKWIIENINLNFFKDYKDFFENGISNDPSFSPKLLRHPRFRSLLEKAIFKRKPEWFFRDLPPRPPIGKTKKLIIGQHINGIKETFTPIQISRETGTNKNTTRRIFQELTKSGTLVRVKRGVYKVKSA